MKLLKILFGIQLLLGYIWVVVSTTPNLLMFGLFIYLSPVQMVFMAISGWMFFKRPETRRLAALVFLIPIALFFLPLVLNKIFGDFFLNERTIFFAPFIVAATLFLLLPQKAGRYLPEFFLGNRVLNLVIIVLQVLLYLAILGSIAQPATNTGYGKGVAILMVAFFSSAVSLVILFYSYLGFFRKDVPESRILRSIQFILSLPIIAFAFNISLQQRQDEIRYREKVEVRKQLQARKDIEQKKLRKINSQRVQQFQELVATNKDHAIIELPHRQTGKNKIII